MPPFRGRKTGMRGGRPQSHRGGSRHGPGKRKGADKKMSTQQSRQETFVDKSDSAEISELEAEEISEPELEVSSSDGEPDGNDGKLSYSTLLQALNANAQRGEPQRKKRKIDLSAAANIFVPSERLANEIPAVETIHVSALDDSGEEDASIQAESGSEDDSDIADVNDDDNEEARENPFNSHLSDVPMQHLNQALQKSASLSWRKSLSNLEGGMKAVSAVPELPVLLQAPLRPIQKLSDLHLKPKIQRSAADSLPKLENVCGQLAGAIFNYQDLAFNDRNVSNGTEISKLYCIHALNHLLKTRDKVIKNNARLAHPDATDEGIDDSRIRDQGFTRPSVLVLLPTRQACAKVVDTMMGILQPEQQENRKRFTESFSEADDLAGSDKPEDFKELFAGNDDDRFLLGVKLTRKTVKYFSSFYKSDIIFASPLGLHAKITAEDKKKRDWDFLSSIEILVVDQADSLIMQNWENVETVLEHLNLEPKESHGCDFARVRLWYLDKLAKFYRQTLVFSNFNTPELNGMFERSMFNIAGKHKISRQVHEGSIMRLGLQLKQTFARFETTSPSSDPDDRFKYFTTSVLPVLAKDLRAGAGKLQGTLIFIPSYMDFLRIQNFFCFSSDTQGILFDEFDLPCISEYATKQQNARAKSLFQSGKHSILLYTGRAHHFYRYKLRGVKRVIMYSLPENPVFYEELVGQILSRSVSEGRFSPDEISAQSIFSKYDALKLEMVVGTKRFATMLKEKGDIFEFF